MNFSVENHMLLKDGNPVSSKPSPNHGGTIKPELIVIHYTGDNGTGGLQWLTTAGSNVSAHLWIAKTGIVWQLLPFNVRAWHAGRSEWDGRQDCNSYSIGIENQGTGDKWPEAQVQAIIGVLVALHRAYPDITGTVGHEDVAPGRKADPGPYFPWAKVYDGLRQAGIDYE
jgi:N-acetylmuramoyl-L-alanine amidase